MSVLYIQWMIVFRHKVVYREASAHPISMESFVDDDRYGVQLYDSTRRRKQLSHELSVGHKTSAGFECSYMYVTYELSIVIIRWQVSTGSCFSDVGIWVQPSRTVYCAQTRMSAHPARRLVLTLKEAANVTVAIVYVTNSDARTCTYVKECLSSRCSDHCCVEAGICFVMYRVYVRHCCIGPRLSFFLFMQEALGATAMSASNWVSTFAPSKTIRNVHFKIAIQPDDAPECGGARVYICDCARGWYGRTCEICKCEPGPKHFQDTSLNHFVTCMIVVTCFSWAVPRGRVFRTRNLPHQRRLHCQLHVGGHVRRQRLQCAVVRRLSNNMLLRRPLTVSCSLPIYVHQQLLKENLIMVCCVRRALPRTHSYCEYHYTGQDCKEVDYMYCVDQDCGHGTCVQDNVTGLMRCFNFHDFSCENVRTRSIFHLMYYLITCTCSRYVVHGHVVCLTETYFWECDEGWIIDQLSRSCMNGGAQTSWTATSGIRKWMSTTSTVSKRHTTRYMRIYSTFIILHKRVHGWNECEYFNAPSIL